MDRRTLAPARRPTSIVACPCCGNPMALKSADSGPEGETIVHSCRCCGAELSRVPLKVAS